MAYGISGAYGKSKKKTRASYSYVPATLGKEDIRGTLESYRDFVGKQLSREPGFTPKRKAAAREEIATAGRGRLTGEMQRARSLISTRGYRGALEIDAQQRAEQAAAEQQRRAHIQLILGEEEVRLEDIARIAGIAGGFAWPAEQARAAGKLASSTATTRGTAWEIQGSYGKPA